MKQKRYRQTRDVNWLEEPKDTVWVKSGFKQYIIPESLPSSSLFGLDLDLLNEEDEDLFVLI